MDTKLIPDIYQPKCNIRYPAHQIGPRVEEYCAQYFKKNDINTSAKYLPIFWDNYMVNHGFGRDIGSLQQWYDEHIKTDLGTRYWTVCEYADGIVIDASPNLHVFYCACDGGTTLSLLCDPHPINRVPESSYIASFMGSLDTHPIRKRLYRLLTGRSGYYVGRSESTQMFRHYMETSKFALCPRGYGPTSYRLYEAIQMGCVPIYIYDVPILPYQDIIKWNSFCIMIHVNDVDKIPSILEGISDKQYQRMKDHLDAMKEMFTMESTCIYIKKYLEQRWPS